MHICIVSNRERSLWTYSEDARLRTAVAQFNKNNHIEEVQEETSEEALE